MEDKCMKAKDETLKKRLFTGNFQSMGGWCKNDDLFWEKTIMCLRTHNAANCLLWKTEYKDAILFRNVAKIHLRQKMR